MKAILEAIKDGRLNATVPVVIANKAEAPALAIAREFGVQAVCVPHQGLSREKHEDAVLTELAEYKVDYVVLAGYMRVLTAHFLQAFRHKDGYFKVINIHPSLLPAFPGAQAYDDAFAYGVRVSGITVHLVDEAVDHGPILAQEAFPRLESDTIDVFKERGLEVEHRLLPAVLEQISRQGIKLIGGARANRITSEAGVRSAGT
jgi:phosphoribosylglycinamide formyltransferase 1